MNKLFLIKLAFRNLFSRKLRTILTLLGIVIGVSAVVFLVSFASGIQRLVTEQITGGDAFLLIDVGTGNSQVVKLNEELQTKIKGIANVKSVETITNLGGKAKVDDKSMDVAFFGVSSSNYLDWTGKRVRWGKNLPDATGLARQVVVNSAYLKFLTKDGPEDTIGRKINFDVILPREISPTGEAQDFTDEAFTIVGVIKDDASPSIYTNNFNLAKMAPAASSQAKVRVANRNEVANIRKEIEALGFKTEYVGDTVAQVEQFFSIFKIVLGSFGLIALMVALLGMFNTLTISLLERIKEVALMKILGMGKRDIRNLFLIEALSLGIIGGILGIVWGVIISKAANIVLNILATRAGGDTVSIFHFTPGLVIIVMAAAILTGLITGLYPARRAERVNALDVLRYE